MAKGQTVVTASLTAQNTFTDFIYINQERSEFLNLSITGLADSTVTVQRTFDGGTTWLDVAAYAVADSVNGSVQKVIESFEDVEAYRVGIKTGEYGTDTVVCRLSH